MKRKAEEDLQTSPKRQRRLWWGDGKEWDRGEMIGEGSFGSVYLAFRKKPISEIDLNDMPPVMAVKSAALSDSGSIQHEAEVFSNIRGCPFVIDYLGEEITSATRSRTSDESESDSDDSGEEKINNLLLEFASGGTLDGLIQSSGGHGLPESDVRSFVAKIADLGLAKRTQDNADGWRGTPMYTDPDALIDHVQKQCSDIWSLGAIVLEMLTGNPPWDVKSGSDLEDFLDMVASQITPNIPTEIPALARNFLNKCLAVNSWERPTAQKLLFHPFVALPQLSQPAHTKVKVVTLSSGNGDEACYFKPNADYHASPAIVPTIQPPPGFEIPAGL